MDEDAASTPRVPVAPRLSTPHEDLPASTTTAQPISPSHLSTYPQEGSAGFARAVGYDPTSDGGGVSPTATPVRTSGTPSFLGPGARYRQGQFTGMSEISPTAGGSVMQQQQSGEGSRHTSHSTAETIRGGYTGHSASQRRFVGGFERYVLLLCVIGRC